MTLVTTRIGDMLVDAGLLSPARLREALSLQQRWKVRLGDVILAKGWVRPLPFYTALAERQQCSFINLAENPPDEALWNPDDAEEYTRLLVLPWRRWGGMVWLVTAEGGEEVEEFARSRFGDDVRFAVTSKFDIIWEVQRGLQSRLTRTSICRLVLANPERSARTVVTVPQLGFLYVLLCSLLLGLFVSPFTTLIVVNAVVTLLYLANVTLRAGLVWVGSSHSVDVQTPQHELDALDETELPVYTILVPMYREAAVLPILAAALRQLDYPIAKLDVKLILEEDDIETIEAAKALALESVFEILRVPPSQPKTKPKACNYGLQFARGELITIYDAEDKPERDQLKKVVAAFRKLPPDTACLQARLNYYNSDENWLTRLFTLDYSLWFDFMIPGLEKLRIPIPLGGTSNHFRTDILRKLHAWDPYNVTEDADLGVRLTAMGYHCGVVNSTTFEEANTKIPNWIRQRSRWVKGYMQTYLVYMRSPLKLYRSLGHVGFWGFQFFIGGSVLVALANPIFWAMFVIWLASETMRFDPIFPPAVLYMSLVSLLLGNAAMTYFSMVSAFKRRFFGLIPFGLTSFVYWGLISVAAYKALWQLIHRPFHWEKTDHGLSSFIPAELAMATRSDLRSSGSQPVVR